MSNLIKPAIWMRKFHFPANGVTHGQDVSYALHYGDPSQPDNERLIAIRWAYMHVYCSPEAQVTCNFGSAGQGGDRNPFEYDMLSCRGRNTSGSFEDFKDFGLAPFPIPHIAQAFAPELAAADPTPGAVFDVTIMVGFNTQASLGW